MPQVPYQPVPDVAAQDTPTPLLRVNVPADAFGANVAQAVKGLGGSMEQVGGELFNRALAFQDVQNHIENDNLYTKFLDQTAGIHADYNSLQGENAAKALPGYLENLNNVRRDLQGQASNPKVAQLFDSATRNQIARDHFSAAALAGDKLRTAQHTAANMRLDAIVNGAGLRPDDDEGFAAREAEVRAISRDNAALAGLPEEAGKEEGDKAVSRMWRRRLTSMAREAPFKAGQLFKDNADKIREDDYDAADKTIRFQTNTTGARQISAGIFNGNNPLIGNKVVSIDAAKRAIGGFESGDRYDLVEKTSGALGRYQIMPENLSPWLKEAGMPNMSPKEFLTDPAAQDRLFAYKFGKYMNDGGSFNEAASRWLTGRSIEDARSRGVKDALGTNVDKYLNKTNAILAKVLPLDKVVDVGNQTAAQISSDPLLPQYVQSHITQQHNVVRSIDRSAKIEAQDTIGRAIQGEFSGGQVPESFDDLKAIPQVQAAIESGALTQNEILQIPGRLFKWQKDLQQKTNDDVKNRLMGMADESPLDFLAIQDFSKYQLSSKDQGAMMALQRKIRKDGPEANPDLTRAYNLIRPQLPSDFGSKANEDMRHQFKGELQSALIYETQEKGKKLTPDEQMKIGQNLLKSVVTKGWWNKMTGGLIPTENRVPFYQTEIPDAAKEAIRKDWDEQGLGEPNEDQLRDTFYRELYIKSYGKKKE